MRQIVCVPYRSLQPDELLFTLVVKRMAMDIKNISWSQDFHRTASTVEKMEHMEDTFSVVRGRRKETTALLPRAWIPWRKSQAVQMITNERCLVQSGLLAKSIMLLCQGQSMGNLLVTWYMAIFCCHDGVACQCSSVLSSLNRAFRVFRDCSWLRRMEKKRPRESIQLILLQPEGQKLADILLKLARTYRDDTPITATLTKLICHQ